MIVECIANRADGLPDNYFVSLARFSRQTRFPVTIGKTYVVYSIAFRLDQVFYCICDDDYEAMDGLYYPSFRPAPLFAINDNRLSEYWRIAHWPEHPDQTVLISYEEWISDPFYYDRLTDREEEAAVTFLRYKNLIDAEFSPHRDSQADAISHVD